MNSVLMSAFSFQSNIDAASVLRSGERGFFEILAEYVCLSRENHDRGMEYMMTRDRLLSSFYMDLEYAVQ